MVASHSAAGGIDDCFILVADPSQISSHSCRLFVRLFVPCVAVFFQSTRTMEEAPQISATQLAVHFSNTIRVDGDEGTPLATTVCQAARRSSQINTLHGTMD